jgi:hypothetical protein
MALANMPKICKERFLSHHFTIILTELLQPDGQIKV